MLLSSKKTLWGRSKDLLWILVEGAIDVELSSLLSDASCCEIACYGGPGLHQLILGHIAAEPKRAAVGTLTWQPSL